MKIVEYPREESRKIYVSLLSDEILPCFTPALAKLRSASLGLCCGFGLVDEFYTSTEGDFCFRWGNDTSRFVELAYLE